MRLSLLSIAATLMGLTDAGAQPTPPITPPQRMHQDDRIRIFYDTEGRHAVDAKDANANGIPDQVEDIMTQTRAAQILFVEVLGFPDPFRTERFKTASFLDIHLRDKQTLKSNGITYDELQRYKRPQDPPGTLSLCFNVATTVKATTNLTPSHEFFHVIQNSTTYFKNRWFTEGTARWSEKAVGLGALGAVRILPSWPLSEENARGVFGMAYEASDQFWNPLCAKTDSADTLPDSPALQRLQSLRYVDGTPVLKDIRLKGWKFIREVLRRLDEEDDQVFREHGYDRWSEKNQTSPENDARILRVVEEVMENMK